MEKDILVILMIAFGLFAVIMFVLFYAYLRKYYNNKHTDYDYENDIANNEEDDDGEDIIETNYSNNQDEVDYNQSNVDEYNDVEESSFEESIPIRKE